MEEHRLYDLSQEVGSNWEVLAHGLGFRAHEIEAIQSENNSVSERAWKLLFEWYSRLGSDAKEAVVRSKLKEIGTKDKASATCEGNQLWSEI